MYKVICEDFQNKNLPKSEGPKVEGCLFCKA